MSAILVNYKDVVTPKSPLFNAITSPPDCHNGFLPGLVLILSPTCLATLTGLPLGPQRLDYINSPSFINGIQTHLFVCYNPHRDLCLLDGSTLSSLHTVLPLLNQTLSPETLLWTSVDIQSPRLEEILRLLISNGFNTPFWTARSPLRSTISPSVALTRSNKSISSQFSPDTVLRKALDAANRNSVNTACLLTAKLSEQAVAFLKRASKSGIVRDRNGKPSQREMTGELVVKDVVSEMDGFVYLIDIDKQSVKTGGPENVNVSATRYNFHSHPEEAYIRHSVEKAWPSVTDYLGFHSLGEHTIFHCVATLEGIYILSFGPYWANRLKKVSRRFIDKRYDIDHTSKYTPEEYVEKVNKICYKRHPIYKVLYFPWNQADTPFKVAFSKIASSCLTTQQGVERIHKLYK